MTNFIEISADTKKIHIKGLDIISVLPDGNNYGRGYSYTTDKTYLGYKQPSILPNYFYVSDYDETVIIYDMESARSDNTMSGLTDLRAKYLRFGGIPSDEVIITINEEIE
jgi:hypothetical protein